jgi:uncharacterized protein
MRIAIVGSGISGLVCAHLLHPGHEITLFEAAPRLGGHTNTVRVNAFGTPTTVDTGFIVFNRRTYPNFCRLVDALKIPHQNAAMSFSVSCESTGLEYGGETFDGLFAQRRNLLRGEFLRMIRDILRFGKEAPRLAAELPEDTTLGQFLERQRYGRLMPTHYLIPMGAAIWSASRRQMLEFPLRFFVRFFDNHGMLLPGMRPQWLTITGGSQRYIDAIVPAFADRVRLSSPVTRVRRLRESVELTIGTTGASVEAWDEAPGQASGPERVESFDHVILAGHSDQSLRMLADASPAEREILGALPYSTNAAVLHTDRRLMPRARRAWAAWNYHLTREEPNSAVLTYDMTRLQSLPLPGPLCVTLNNTAAIDASAILRRFTYHHPQYSLEGVQAQAHREEISGVNRTSYAGAYWFNGFHEDGVRSALEACKPFGVGL